MSSKTPSIVLKPKKNSPHQRWHPWIFTGAIAEVTGDPALGETVAICDHKGRQRGWGAYSPSSQIAVRVWSFDTAETVDTTLWRRLLEAAKALRAPLRDDPKQTAYRIVNAESDGFPGLIVDRYDDWLVCQFLAAGVERHKAEITALLADIWKPKGIYERSDAKVRKKEGLLPHTGVLHGEAPPETIEIIEGACRFLVDVYNGHKTGFYLDQRDNRAAVAAAARRKGAGLEVLNCFSYTGGFGLAAAVAGASVVTHIDASGPALALAAQSLERNAAHHNLSAHQSHFVEADVFQQLRDYREEGRQFDLIVMDPPKFIESKHNLERGCRGYKDVNMLAFQLLRPGGELFTFSCSGLMPPDLFQKVIADAALDAKVRGSIIGRLGQPLDHPTALPFPEGTYLKGLHCLRQA